MRCSLFAALEVRYCLKQKPTVHHQPIQLSNRFFALSDATAEKPILVIGSSILHNVKFSIPATLVKFILGARVSNMESNLKLMAIRKRKYNKIVIHVGSNDVRLRLSDVTKVNVESVCAFAKTRFDSVVFSGHLPNLTSDDMLSHVSSLNCWLSRWCPANEVGFIDNWQTFLGKTWSN